MGVADRENEMYVETWMMRKKNEKSEQSIHAWNEREMKIRFCI